MTWAALVTEIVAGMTANGYTRIDGQFDMEEDSQLPSSDIHDHYTLKLKGITGEDIRRTDIGSFLIEIKLGFATKDNTDYDTEMKEVVDLVQDMAKDGNTNFTHFIDFVDDPEVNDAFEPYRVVVIFNLEYGIKGCP